MDIPRSLLQGIGSLELVLPDGCSEQMMAYLQLVQKWNKAFNLTAITDVESMVVKHLLDSLSILPFVENSPVLDVGTGAGLPGVILAMARPQYRFTLLDTNGKKCRFLNHVKTTLQLHNLDIVHSRVQDYQATTPYPVVTARAFATLGDITHNVIHLIADNGVILAMKGQRPDNEIENLGSPFILDGIYPIAVPGLDAERHLVRVRKISQGSRASETRESGPL